MPYSVIPVTGLVLGPIGSISQTDFPLVSARQVNATDTLNINFGDPFVLNENNTYSSVAQFIATYGVFALLSLAEANPSDPFGIAKDSVQPNTYYPLNGGTHMPAGAYLPGMMVNGLTRGTATVAINNGTRLVPVRPSTFAPRGIARSRRAWLADSKHLPMALFLLPMELMLGTER
jgi:hypothetical protein